MLGPSAVKSRVADAKLVDAPEVRQTLARVGEDDLVRVDPCEGEEKIQNTVRRGRLEIFPIESEFGL